MERPQVLLIDDQPLQVLPWLQEVLDPFEILPIDSMRDLAIFIDALNNSEGETFRSPLPRLPDGPYDPIAALIDLDLGPFGGTGIAAVHALRQNPSTSILTPILFTNGLGGGDSRDLQAVICAYAADGGVIASNKTLADAKRLLPVLATIKALATLDQPFVARKSINGLRYVSAIRFRDARNDIWSADLIDILLGSRGLRALWGEYELCGRNFDAAVRAVRDEFPDLTLQLREPQRSGRMPSSSNGPNEFINRSTFGDLMLAWHREASFLRVQGEILEPPDSAIEDQSNNLGQGKKREAFAAFAGQYGKLLSDSTTQAFASWHLDKNRNSR